MFTLRALSLVLLSCVILERAGTKMRRNGVRLPRVTGSWRLLCGCLRGRLWTNTFKAVPDEPWSALQITVCFPLVRHCLSEIHGSYHLSNLFFRSIKKTKDSTSIQLLLWHQCTWLRSREISGDTSFIFSRSYPPLPTGEKKRAGVQVLGYSFVFTEWVVFSNIMLRPH